MCIKPEKKRKEKKKKLQIIYTDLQLTIKDIVCISFSKNVEKELILIMAILTLWEPYICSIAIFFAIHVNYIKPSGSYQTLNMRNSNSVFFAGFTGLV